METPIKMKNCKHCIDEKKELEPLYKGKFWCWHCYHYMYPEDGFLYHQCGKCGKMKREDVGERYP